MDLTPVPTSTDIQVNTSNRVEYSPKVTVLGDGGFLVTWTSSISGLDIFGQRFDSAGIRAGDEFRISTTEAGGNHLASATALSDGGFVVTWSSNHQDGSEWGVYCQRFDLNSNPVGTEFRANTETTNYQIYSTITALSGGGFVVTWSSLGQDGDGYGIYGQRYSSSGEQAGTEFLINTYTTSEQWGSSVTSLSNGGFLATWTSNNQDGSQGGIYGQRFDGSGTPIGEEFRANTTTVLSQYYPATEHLAHGGIVVLWEATSGQDSDIFGRVFSSDGIPVGDEFRANTRTFDVQTRPSVAATSDGGFVVTWSSYNQDGDGYSIYGQRFDAGGTAIGSEFRLNSITQGHQFTENAYGNESIVTLPDGQLVATWAGTGNEEVFVRLFDVPSTSPDPACFLAGTMIRTPTVEVEVENLSVGDLVVTADGRALPVKWIGKQAIVTRFADPTTSLPICIMAGALGVNLPSRDLYTSPGHSMLLEGILVLAGALVNGTSIHRMKQVPERFTYFHIELDEHAVIFAEGAPTESYCDNVPREVFDNAAAYKLLYPNTLPIEQLDIPTAKSARQLPTAIRNLLRVRTNAIGAMDLTTGSAAASIGGTNHFEIRFQRFWTTSRLNENHFLARLINQQS